MRVSRTSSLRTPSSARRSDDSVTTERPLTAAPGPAAPAAQPVLSAAGIGSRSISQTGQVPLASETTVGCMGQKYVGAAPLDVLSSPDVNAAGTASSFIPQMGHLPGVSVTTVACIGQRYFPDAAAGVDRRGAGPAALIGTSFMPQMGQFPGLSETTVGCMGQWYFVAAAEPAAAVIVRRPAPGQER